MKHLKKYENNNYNDYWLVVGEYSDDPEASFHELFGNRDSADNFIIVAVNEHREDIAKMRDEQFTDNDLFLTISEAEEWIDNSYNLKLYSYRINYNKTYELPEKYKLLADARKYNI